MRFIIPLTFVLALFSTGPADAAIIFWEDFNGFREGDLYPHEGWEELEKNDKADHPIQIVATPSDPKNLFVQLGQTEGEATFSGQDLVAAFDSSAVKEIVVAAGSSVTLSLTLSISAAQQGDYFFAFSNGEMDGKNSSYGKLFAKTDDAKGFFLGLAGSDGEAEYGRDSLDLDQTYHVALTWKFGSGKEADVFTLSINDRDYLSIEWNDAALDASQLNSFVLRQGAGELAPVVALDNLRVDYQSGYQVPESIAPMLLGCSALLLRGRRRRLLRN